MTTHVAYLATPRRASLVRVLEELAASVTAWYKRRTAIAELRRLPDHLLSDIGLVRAGIPAAVDGMMNNRR